MLSGHLARVTCCNMTVAASFVMRVALGAAAADAATAVEGVDAVLIGSLLAYSNEKKREVTLVKLRPSGKVLLALFLARRMTIPTLWSIKDLWTAVPLSDGGGMDFSQASKVLR